MSVSESQAKLKQAAKDLWARWRLVREVWQDENCQKFEKKYLTPLQAELRAAEVAMDHIDTLINRIQRDCK